MTASIENGHGKEPLAGVNQGAPIVGRDEIEIGTPPEVVWDVLTAFEGWRRCAAVSCLTLVPISSRASPGDSRPSLASTRRVPESGLMKFGLGD